MSFIKQTLAVGRSNRIVLLASVAAVLLSAMAGAGLAMPQVGYYAGFLIVTCLVLGYMLLTLGIRLTSLVLVVLTSTLDLQYVLWKFPVALPILTGSRNNFIIQLVDIPIALMAAVYLDTRRRSKGNPQLHRFDRVTGLYLALCLASVVSLLGARYPELGIYELPILFKGFIVFYVVRNSVYSMDEALLLAKTLVVVLALQASLGIYHCLADDTLGLWMLGEPRELNEVVFSDMRVSQGAGTLGNANGLASYIVLVLPSTAALFVAGRGWRDRILGAVGFMIGMAGIAATVGRSALIVIAMILPVTVLLLQRQSRPQKSYRLVILVSSIGLFLALFGRLLVVRVTSLRPTMASFYMRVSLISESFRLFLNKPLFGVGLGNATLEIYRHASPSVPLPHLKTPVHNIVLLWLAETGLVGIILYGLLLVSVVAPMWRGVWYQRDRQSLVIGAFAMGILGTLAHNQAVWALRWSIPLQINFWFVAGLGLALCQCWLEGPKNATYKTEGKEESNPNSLF